MTAQKRKRPPRETPWTLEEALVLIREANPVLEPQGWALGLTGSVLVQGESAKDLDLIAYPLDSAEVVHSNLSSTLETLDWFRQWDSVDIHGFWRRAGSTDRKHVEVWYTQDEKRIDLFILT